MNVAVQTKQINAISLIFFISGCSALVFETIWFRIASTVLGSSVWSAAAVLMAFMTGLGMGNAIIALYGRRLGDTVKVYAVLEVIIGVTGVLSILLLPLLSPLVARAAFEILQQNWLLILVRFTFAFAVFVIPAIAMGMTLPVLQKILFQFDNSFSSSFGRLYGWNTAGAVCGVLLAEFVLIKFIGIRHTALAACLLNFIAAFLILKLLHGKHVTQDETEHMSDEMSVKGVRLLLIIPMTSGMIMMALEVIWFRYMLLGRGGTSAIFAVMLMIILSGIAVGGIIAHKINIFKVNLDNMLNSLLLIASASVVSGFYLYYLFFAKYVAELNTNIYLFGIAAVILMFPTSLVTGILFPLYGEKIFRHIAETTRSSGLITLVNTIGAALGSGIATFLLLPLLGVEKSVFILATAYAVLAFFLVAIDIGKRQRITSYVASIITIILIVFLFPNGVMVNSYKILAAKKFPGEHIVAIKEGLNETVQYYRKDLLGKPYKFRLVTNNFSMSATGFLPARYMKTFAYFPYIVHGDIKNVLLISYGVGNTAEAITQLDSVKRLDVVDISKDVLDLSRIVSKQTGHFPLKDKRTHVHIEDGRFYLQTHARKYDLITGEPPPPKANGVVNLYSLEYFKLIKSRLNSGGMVTYWLPVHSLHDEDTLAIIKAFCHSFTDCSLWNGGGMEFMLVGTNGYNQKINATKFRNVWNSYLANELKSLGFENPGELCAIFLADSTILNKLTSDTLPVTDNYPLRISADTSGFAVLSRLDRYLLDFDRKVNAFNRSEYIRSIFPREIINDTNANFRNEESITLALLNLIPFESIGYWEELSYMLQHTNLRTLPLLWIGGRPGEQKIINSGVKDDAANYQFVLVQGFIVNRQYDDAIKALQNLLNSQGGNKYFYYYRELYLFIKAIKTNKLDMLEVKNLLGNDNKEYVRKFIAWLITKYPLRS